MEEGWEGGGRVEGWRKEEDGGRMEEGWRKGEMMTHIKMITCERRNELRFDDRVGSMRPLTEPVTLFI